MASSEVSKEFKQTELDQHVDALNQFLARQDNNRPATCTMILRSPRSGPAQALMLMTDALRDADVRVQVIVAKLEPLKDLRELLAALAALSANTDMDALIRWARDPRLLEAHEQATYGCDMNWSGDAMRRDADKRNPLVLFEMDAPAATRRGTHAFKELWRASVPVPPHCISPSHTAKPSGSSEYAPVTALRPQVQGLPLVRH